MVSLSAMMKSSTMKRAIWLAALIALLDQASKWVMLHHVMEPPRILKVTDFFNLVLTFNTGVSFGLLGGDSPWRPWLLSAMAVAIVVALFVWLYREPSKAMALAVGLVSGGALGNVVDRLFRPGVVDFLDFHVAGYHWPAFNLADSTITLGVVVLLYDGLFSGASKGNK